MRIAYRTQNGVYYNGKIEDVLTSCKLEKYKGKINLDIYKSPLPPEPEEKVMAIITGQSHLNWIKNIGSLFYDYLGS